MNAPFPPQFPPPMPQPRPRKSHGCLYALLGAGAAFVLLVVVIVVAAMGAGSGGGKTDAASGGKPGGRVSAKAETAKVGQRVRDGKFTFTVTKIEDGVAHLGPSGVGDTAQGQYVLVSVKVTNHGDEAQYLDDSAQYLYSRNHKKFSVDPGADIDLDGNNVWLNQINPGNTVKGVFVFDVPKHVDLDRIELHDSMFSGGVTVDLG